MRKAMSGIIGILVAVMLSALLTACGGGSGGGGTSSLSKATTTGVFANVSGLGFSTGSQAGATGASGSFTFVAGETATFKVGDIVIGQTTAGSTLTPLHFFTGVDASDPTAVNIARFLMSIGTYDAVKLTIAIPSAVLSAANGKTFNFNTAVDPITGQPLLDLVKSLNSNATLVDAATATDFLSRLIYKYYGGTYSGVFTGEAADNSWVMTINKTDGSVAGTGIGTANETLGGNMTNGIIFNGFASGGCALVGKLNLSTMRLEGDWTYTDPLNIRPSKTGKFF